MFRTLLKMRFTLWWAGIRAAKGSSIFALVSIIGLGIATAWYARGAMAYAVAQDLRLARAGMLLAFLVLAIFRITSGIKASIERLYLSSDLELLMAVPIPQSTLFALKASETALSGPGSLGLLAILAYSYGYATGSPFAPLTAVAATGLLAVMAALVALTLSLGLIRLIPPARIRTGLSLLAPLVTFGTIFITRNFFGDDGTPSVASNLEPLLDGLRRAGAKVAWYPSSWAANIAAPPARATQTVVGLLLAGGLIGLLFVAGRVLFRATFYTTWERINESATKAKPARSLDRYVPLVNRQSRAIVVKDWRHLTRDLRALMQLFVPLMFISFLTITELRGGSGSAFAFAPYLALTLGNLAQQAFLHEGRNWTLLRSTPVTAKEIFMAKYMSYAVPVSIFGVAIMGWQSVTSHQAPASVVMLLIATVLVVSGLIVVNLSFAAMFADFSIEKPKVTLIGYIGSGVFGLVYLVATGLPFAWLIARIEANKSLLASAIVGTIGLITLIGANGGALALSKAAIRRLDRQAVPR